MSDMNSLTGRWVGYQDRPLEAMLYFSKPEMINSVTLSTYEDLGAWIFPPKRIEIWGGTSANNLSRLVTYSPEQPADTRGRQLTPIVVSFAPSSVKYLKILAAPVILPSWHPEKGKKGYVFVDEVFVN
jgi:hypothetical protein